MFHKNDALRKKHLLKTEAETLVHAAIKAGKDITGKDLERYNTVVAELGEISFRLDLHERNMPQPDGGATFVNVENGFTPTVSRGNSKMHELYAKANTEVRAAIDGVVAYLQTGRISANANLSPTSDGGLLIPSSLQLVMEEDYAQFAPVVGVCKLYPTETGEKVTFPVLSDSESAVQLAPEALTGADATVSGDTPPTAITGPQLGAWKASSKPVYVPRELQVDSPINVINEVVGALLARIIRFENLKYTKGVGTTEAAGFLHDATAYNAGSTSTVLDLDIALDLAYSVPALYRPNGVYMASDSTIKYLRKLKTGISGDKRNLWKDVFEEGNATLGTPAKLHGYPIFVNNDMDSVASDGTFASVSPLVFGDFSKFVVRQAEMGQAYLRRYEVPAKDGAGVILFRRSDSKLVVPTAVNKLTCS